MMKVQGDGHAAAGAVAAIAAEGRRRTRRSGGGGRGRAGLVPEKSSDVWGRWDWK